MLIFGDLLYPDPVKEIKKWEVLQVDLQRQAMS